MLGRALSELEQNQYNLKSSTDFCKELVSLKVCWDVTQVHVLHRDYYRLWRLPCTAYLGATLLSSYLVCKWRHTLNQSKNGKAKKKRQSCLKQMRWQGKSHNSPPHLPPRDVTEEQTAEIRSPSYSVKTMGRILCHERTHPRKQKMTKVTFILWKICVFSVG